MNRLVYEHEGKQVEIRLGSKPVSLGRSDEADHKLPTKLASRIHAQVFQRDHGWWVEDLGSSNGTILNGARIEAPTALKPGDVITVGDVKVRYEGDGATPQGAPDKLLARLLYQPEKGKPPVELIVRDRVTIGRKPDNTLQIDTKAVSGYHCEVINRQGAYLLRDLGSSNGTYIGKQQVTEHTLRNGEILLLGKTVPVYFVDPAGAPVPSAQPAPAAPAAAPAAAKAAPVAAASSAAGASDRGQFAPVRAEPAAKPPRNPLPHVAVGLALGALFVLAGWLMGEVITGFRTPRDTGADQPKPAAALADSAFSFEGDIDDNGNPDGWSASFEATGGGKAELLSDADRPYDGARSLRVKAAGLSGAATLVLQTSKARPIDLGGECKVSLFARAEGGQKIAVALSVLGETGKSHTVAVGSFSGLRAGEWVQLELSGKVLTPLPANGSYRLLLCGNYSQLWIDRLEISKTADGPADKPFRKLTSSDVGITLDADAPARALVENGKHGVKLVPRMLAFGNEGVSEHDLWAVQTQDSSSVTYSALLPGFGDTATCKLEVSEQPSPLLAGNGLKLQWDLKQGNVESLAVEIELPLPAASAIMIADRRDMPLEVDRTAIHTYAYSTIRELMVSDTDLSVSFPDGAVVWLDLSRPGRLVAVVRAALGETRRTMSAVVYTRPLMYARFYERVYDEAFRMWGAQRGSAAKVRLHWLLDPVRPQRGLAAISKARALLEKLDDALLKLRETVDSAYESADRTRTTQAVEVGRKTVQRYIETWPGEADVAEMQKRLEKLKIWQVEIDARKRTPQEMQQAEASARRLWQDAQSSNKDGHVLLCLVLLENILRDFADTSVHRDASVLYEQVNARMKDPKERDKLIDVELLGIDEDIKFKDYSRARDRCLKLFKRFPDTPRNRDIMKRLRQVEDAFQE
ncbi:MAG: FHA domain-containing protein [Planctomycetes bacterium]|nr:FHA domain-containing protein [Planctomycetota bacterium]